MASFVLNPSVNGTNDTYIFAIPPVTDKNSAIAGLVLSSLPILLLLMQLKTQYQKKGSEKPKTEKPADLKEAAKNLKKFFIGLLILWLLSMILSFIENLLFLLGQFLEINIDNVVTNSIYSFWLNEIIFSLSFATICVILTIWMRMLIGINKRHNVSIPSYVENESRIVVSLLFFLIVGTIVCLAVLRPYCFPAFQSAELNDQCVQDDTNLRNDQFRWVIFGIRLFVFFPVVILMIYFWVSFRPATLDIAVPRLLMYRQLMEFLLVSQLIVYVLQLLATWVPVFYPDMEYSTFKNLKLICVTVPNVLLIVGTVFYMKRIKGKTEGDGSNYQELDTVNK